MTAPARTKQKVNTIKLNDSLKNRLIMLYDQQMNIDHQIKSVVATIVEANGFDNLKATYTVAPDISKITVSCPEENS